MKDWVNLTPKKYYILLDSLNSTIIMGLSLLSLTKIISWFKNSNYKELLEIQNNKLNLKYNNKIFFPLESKIYDKM